MNNTLEQFKRLRLAKGWTQSQLADKIGVKVRTLRSWEQGSRTPKPIVLGVVSQFIASTK